jgi:YD repeat-containing protein
MFPESGDRFFEGNDAGSILFVRDAAGKVTELIYHGPGRITVIARKVS